jgi:hypothetical protein
MSDYAVVLAAAAAAAAEDVEEVVPETPPGGDAANYYSTLASNAQVHVVGTSDGATAAATSSSTSSLSSLSVREIGGQATWSLSSCKPGFGVDQLRDDSTDTYWQSDGQLPHLVNIQFRRKVAVHDVAIYTDFKLDESYTPSKVGSRNILPYTLVFKGSLVHTTFYLSSSFILSTLSVATFEGCVVYGGH